MSTDGAEALFYFFILSKFCWWSERIIFLLLFQFSLKKNERIRRSRNQFGVALAGKSAVCHLVYFVNSRRNYYAKPFEISAMSIHSKLNVKLNSSRLYVCLLNAQNGVKWHHLTLFLLTSFARITRCVKSKSKCGLYLVSWRVLYFGRINKCHNYATLLWSNYFV